MMFDKMFLNPNPGPFGMPMLQPKQPDIMLLKDGGQVVNNLKQYFKPMSDMVEKKKKKKYQK